MSKIAFVTDSTCNLPPELVSKYNINVVPIYVVFGEQSYKDDADLTIEKFYSKLLEYKALDKGMPTTSQPTPEDFRTCYTGLAQQGFTDIISVHVSAKFSGTCQSAELGKANLEGINVHVVDSTSASMPMGFMLLEAIEAIAEGGGVEQALAAIKRVQAHSCLIFTVAELDHLSSSGRTEDHEIATEALLSENPVVAITDGVPKAVEIERTQEAALNKVLQMVNTRKGAARLRRLAIVHGNVAIRAVLWAQDASAALDFDKDPMVVDFGPSLAVHFGPGLLGVAAQWE
jgi:DegV family protein with EDD domain